MQRQCQAAIFALNEGSFEKVAEVLDEFDKENLRLDQTYLIGVALQICVACIRSKADLAWHQQALEAESQRIDEFTQQLSNILQMISKPGYPPGSLKPEEMPGAALPPAPFGKPQAQQKEKQPGIWQRVRSFLGMLPAPPEEEESIPAAELPAAELLVPPTQETPLLLAGETAAPAPEMPVIPLPETPPEEEENLPETVAPLALLEETPVPPPVEETAAPAPEMPVIPTQATPLEGEENLAAEVPFAPIEETTMPPPAEIPLLPAPPPFPVPEVEEVAGVFPPGPGKSARPSPSLIIYCLGLFHVYQGDREITEWHSFKGRDIFKYLLLRRETPVSRDILIDVFWPDTDPQAARRNLHQTIYSLRQTLRGEQPEFNHIWFKNDCYSLNPGMNIWLDFVEFEQHAQAGARLEKAGRIAEAIDQYGTAEGLYQGDFLEEDLYEDWPAILRERLLNVYLGVVDRLCDLYFQDRQYAVVISLCRKVLAKDRCNETAHRWLIQCYLAYGQRHLAVRQYQTCVKALREELNLPPSDETVALYQRMMAKGDV